MDFLTKNKKLILISFALSFAFFYGTAYADLGEDVKFNVDKSFDAQLRSEVSAVLVKTDSNFYFYVEKQWWNNQPQLNKDLILSNLSALSVEFSNNIYPNLTNVFGKEWTPGVDNDKKITILFEQMNNNEGGYFRTADEYVDLQVPDSNEREILYLSLDKISSSNLKVYLAHEFMHLITFNQKNKINKIEEDTWLNEARADYSSTLLGYDSVYAESNLEARVKDFVANPSDSITEWTGTKYDYASVSMFTHYLVDRYGLNILSDSLKSDSVGIESLNYALQKSGSRDTFAQIFTNWTIASLVNNCSLGLEYCYLDSNLKSIKVSPTLNYIPVSGNASLYIDDATKNWEGNWIKFIGGSGNLKLDFSTISDLVFIVPYVLEGIDGNKTINFMSLDGQGRGELKIENFGTNYKSIIILPSLQSKVSGFDSEKEISYPFTYSAEAESESDSIISEYQALISQLLEKISLLREEVAKLQGKSGEVSSGKSFSCSAIGSNLYYGATNILAVKCLQEFLKLQGSDIYPEGYVTGIFGNLTQAAVVRFQEKYASDILTPFGISKGTGYVGEKTRQKINQMLVGQ